jgi:hypothetical protein
MSIGSGSGYYPVVTIGTSSDEPFGICKYTFSIQSISCPYCIANTHRVHAALKLSIVTWHSIQHNPP